jgi:CheY-like chemotaxis protein
MPVKSGFEATAMIRKHELEHGLLPTPIIALTAHAMIGYRVLLPSPLTSGKMSRSRNE